MPLVPLKVVGNSSHATDLRISITGSALNITCSGILSSNSVTIADTTYTIVPDASKRSVIGYIVKNKTTGEISLMFDEVKADERSYSFKDSPDLDLLERVIWFDLPASASTFDGVNVGYLQIDRPKPPPVPSLKPTPPAPAPISKSN